MSVLQKEFAALRPRATGITDAEIMAAKALGSGKRNRLELIDGLEPGLRLRVLVGSARWYVLAKTGAGMRARIPLGVWPVLAVADARSAARTIKQNLALVCGDAEEGAATVGVIFDRYKARRLSQLRKGVVMGNAIHTALDGLRHRELSTITRMEVSRIIDDMADRAPIGANRTLAYLKAFFSWASGRGYIEVNPICSISKPTREIARERTPTLEEIGEIWVAADQMGYPFGQVIKLLILTAARREEVGAIRCAELDLPNDDPEGCWIIPADRSKNGRALRVPLAGQARTVVEAALKTRPKGCAFLFSTTAKTSVSGWSKAKSRIDGLIAQGRSERRQPPMADWRFHDLRRSFATSACDVLGIDPAVADRCLNHVGAGTTSTISRVYARNEMYQQRADALRRWGELVCQSLIPVAKGQPD